MLQLSNVKKSFSGVFEPVLKGIDFCLEPKDFCVVIGANGSGKSTLLKVISGEHKPDSGKIKRRGLISQVVQDVNRGTIPAMTLLENVALSQMRSKKPTFSFYSRYRKEVREKIEALNIGLEKYIDQPLGALSGGQRQTIATLMAINSGGQILLLDEHTSALDPKMQVTLMEYTVKSVLECQLTTMMITHNMEDAIKYGNRLIMLHKGRIVVDIKCEEKAKLNAKTLLSLFHEYEDQSLLSGGKNVH
ncbi:ABC transporter ATP-binding protein [Alphaproteobacteria bacterium]|nr:ABC transporter ATP-binding protein [Alphaproteobacteria bacterium]